MLMLIHRTFTVLVRVAGRSLGGQVEVHYSPVHQNEGAKCGHVIGRYLGQWVTDKLFGGQLEGGIGKIFFETNIGGSCMPLHAFHS